MYLSRERLDFSRALYGHVAAEVRLELREERIFRSLCCMVVSCEIALVFIPNSMSFQIEFENPKLPD